MSVCQPAVISELLDEAERLNLQVAALQQRLARYESAEARAIADGAPQTAAVSPWADWPYCWVAAANDYFERRWLRLRHALHEWRVTRYNRRQRAPFRRHSYPEELHLELL